MTNHKTGTRQEWLAARIELLKVEKEHTRRGDELARQRQALPWVRIEKKYQFETDEGKTSLADLFQGRSQLLVYHFMFGPDYTGGCPSCSSIADSFNGFWIHLANHDVMFWAISRVPPAKLQAYKQRMGWNFPWASSFNSDFNADFNVTLTEEQQRQEGFEYNYRREPAWLARTDGGIANSLEGNPVAQIAVTTGTDAATYIRERPGIGPAAYGRRSPIATGTRSDAASNVRAHDLPPHPRSTAVRTFFRPPQRRRVFDPDRHFARLLQVIYPLDSPALAQRQNPMKHFFRYHKNRPAA